MTIKLVLYHKLELRKIVKLSISRGYSANLKKIGSAKKKHGLRKKNIFLLKISPHCKEREREREREREIELPKRPKLSDKFLKPVHHGQHGSQPGELTHFLFICNLISLFICVYMVKILVLAGN
jgi:hypothetical protein